MKTIRIAVGLAACCLVAGCTSCGENTGLDGRHHDIVVEPPGVITDYWIKDSIAEGVLLIERGGAGFDGYDVIKRENDDLSNTYRVRVYGRMQKGTNYAD